MDWVKVVKATLGSAAHSPEKWQGAALYRNTAEPGVSRVSKNVIKKF